MSLTHRVFSDALRDMQRGMAVFDQPFFNSVRHSFLNNQGSVRYPASDMVETPNSYELSAELPGYDKKTIKIELADSRTLVLSGSMEEQHETKSEITKDNNDQQQLDKQTPQYWFKERVSGSFSRSFSFPTPINPDSIKASFENGVLKVTVPKADERQAKQIDID